MGTSSDYKGGSGGAWTPFKRAATDYAKHGGTDLARRVVARHITALGGSAQAAKSAATGVASAQQFAGFLAGIATQGLSDTLSQVGLADLVGRGRFEIVRGLVDAIAGAGSDLDGQAARGAALDVIDELFGEREGYDELAELTLNEAQLVSALEAFVAYYVYNRLLRLIDERLTRFANPARAEQLDSDLRELIRAQVRVRLRDANPLLTDWRGAEGQQIVEGLIRGAYAALADLEE